MYVCIIVHAHIRMYIHIYIHIHIHAYVVLLRGGAKQSAAAVVSISNVCMYVCMYLHLVYAGAKRTNWRTKTEKKKD